jgi:hypothetical protein
MEDFFKPSRFFPALIFSGVLTAIFAFAAPPHKDGASVNQYQGVYVFTDSSPTAEYKVLGSVKPKGRGLMAMGVKSVQYTSVRDAMIKAAKDAYPQANGVILTFSAGSADNCDAIEME